MRRDIIELVIAIFLGAFAFWVYQKFTVTSVGIFHKNNCGTYDRWLVWVKSPAGVFPSGLAGKDPKDCFLQEVQQ